MFGFYHFIVHSIVKRFAFYIKDLQLFLSQGEPMQSKDEAKQAVAIKACIQLHKEGALNDNLLPVGNSSDSESEDVDGTDGSRAKTGTKKRQRRHNIKVSYRRKYLVV